MFSELMRIGFKQFGTKRKCISFSLKTKCITDDFLVPSVLYYTEFEIHSFIPKTQEIPFQFCKTQTKSFLLPQVTRTCIILQPAGIAILCSITKIIYHFFKNAKNMSILSVHADLKEVKGD